MTALNSHAQVVAADSHEPKVHATTHQDGGSDEIDITGLTGVPTRASLGLATSDSPQFAGVNVGHASDTTVTRDAAGDLAVEGNRVYRAGGTDVPVADGGTGASTAAAAATNLGLGTGDSPQHAGVNVGHATDTTIGRTSAGVVNVEGKDVYMAGGADVAVADGGTGASTASGARTNLGISAANTPFTPNGSIAATDVQAAIQEVRDEAGGGAAFSSWAAWTPTLTATTTNPTLGTGGSATGRYVQNPDKTVNASGIILFGSSGVAAGSGEYLIALPVARNASAIGQVMGTAVLYDDSAGKFMPCAMYLSDSTHARIANDSYSVAGLIVSNSVPQVWAANDAIIFTLMYEGA